MYEIFAYLRQSEPQCEKLCVCGCEYLMNSTVKLVALSQHARHTRWPSKMSAVRAVVAAVAVELCNAAHGAK